MLDHSQIEQLAEQLADLVADRLAARLGAIAKPTSSEACLSRKQVANLLQVGVATVDRMVSAGEIPSRLVNRRRVFIAAEVMKTLSGSTLVESRST